MKKCADFQAKGGNCVLLIPELSTIKCELYEKYVQHTTIRVNLKLVKFGGFEDVLKQPLVLLYFLQPKLLQQLSEQKVERPIEMQQIVLEDQTRLQIIHRPTAKKAGRKPNYSKIII